MIKILFLCRRLPGLTPAEYLKRVREHVPKALRHHPTMRAYLTDVVEQRSPEAPETDHVSTLYFERLSDFREKLYDSPEGERIILDDVAGFLGGSHTYVTREQVHKREAPAAPLGQRTPGTKWLCALARPEGLSHEDLVERWLGQQVPALLESEPNLERLVTNVVERRLTRESPEWDLIVEFRGIDPTRLPGPSASYALAEFVQKPAR